ncbi:hypothetical protein [Chryseobacterium oncorhynchi]|uniref:Uncharacterized protein n=1 Tax=Chryseobacterium oncorhynchi TaxID=741074 RepID=A0A316WLW0_9FLAO|nr:hypothetical protein [Chryseobacterium oncorhynchi]PWN60168.1 hypothetical protein C1638_020465 [Chryseobacterium oncorhynchi]
MKNYIVKNWRILFKIQITGFIIFIISTVIYYWNTSAHASFNRNTKIIDLQGVFSLIMTYLFVFFSVVTLVYPVLFFMQAYFIRKERSVGKELILLAFLYLLSIFSVFALFMINTAQAIKNSG